MNGMGPFSLWGSRLDSGACCQTEVQERSALLCNAQFDIRRDISVQLIARLTPVYLVPLWAMKMTGLHSGWKVR